MQSHFEAVAAVPNLFLPLLLGRALSFLEEVQGPWAGYSPRRGKLSRPPIAIAGRLTLIQHVDSFIATSGYVVEPVSPANVLVSDASILTVRVISSKASFVVLQQWTIEMTLTDVLLDDSILIPSIAITLHRRAANVGVKHPHVEPDWLRLTDQ